MHLYCSCICRDAISRGLAETDHGQTGIDLEISNHRPNLAAFVNKYGNCFEIKKRIYDGNEEQFCIIVCSSAEKTIVQRLETANVTFPKHWNITLVG